MNRKQVNMLRRLKLKNTGPIPDQTIEFGERLNIITGDNGLGKSFLLDIVWYALTRKWAGEINPHLTSGYMARPLDPTKPASITFDLETENGNKIQDYAASFDREDQAWVGKAGRPYSAGLVVYAHSDGSFSVWDPARNYWKTRNGVDIQDHLPAFVFSPSEVWNGLKDKDDKPLSNGLIADWAKWQNDSKGWEFPILETMLEQLSPPEFVIKSGSLTRIAVNDPRDIPTIKMNYGEVPVLWASAGIRRILAFAYFLTWALSEHIRACKVLGTQPSIQITFLIDEIESHLHPKWQRQIMNGIIEVLDKIPYVMKEKTSFLSLPSQGSKWGNNKIQVIATTHSPLVMVALEDRFDYSVDKWFDFDSGEKGEVCFTTRDFEKLGDANAWLVGKAFDLNSARSPEAETAVQRMNELMQSEKDLTNSPELKEAYKELLRTLSPLDDILFTIRYTCEKKGWNLK